MSISSKPSFHFTVVCSRCRVEAEVCPQRKRDLVWAAGAFRKTGWHLDADRTVRMGNTRSDYDWGKGTWYCPECRGRVR